MTTRVAAMLLGMAISLVPATTYGQQTEAPVEPTDTTKPVELQVDLPQEPSDASEGFVAKMRRIAAETQIMERMNGDVDGWYPRLGGMTRGSGFSLGPGYRTHLFGDRILVDLSAGLSIKAYRTADAKVRWLQAYGDRVELWTDVRYEHFPQEDFYGRGMDTLPSFETSYNFDSTDVMVRGLVKPTRWLRLGSSVGYLRPDIGRGTDSRVPSIEDLFGDADAPGLFDTTRYLHTTLFGELDRRDVPGNPTRGGFYRASFGVWDDREDRFDHRRFDAIGVQHVALTSNGAHVLSGRLGTSYVNNETGQRVPFYFLAYVGGVDTIRSLNEFRFKDENAMWMGAEYRWRFYKYASVVTFFDAGKVAADWQDLSFSGLKKGYGFGFRAHTRTQTLARLDFGTGGGEGWAVFLKVGPSF